MSEESKGVSDALENTVSDGAQETDKSVSNGDNTVNYQTHKKLLGQHKKTMSELDTLREEIASLRNEKLEVEGNKDQLIDSLKKEVNDTKSKLRTTVGNVARTQAMNAIVEEAVKAGCNSPEVVKRFLEGNINDLTFDSDFKPDRDEVRDLIENARTTAPVLLGKEAPKISNHNTSGSAGSGHSTNDIKKMSIDDLMNSWANVEN